MDVDESVHEEDEQRRYVMDEEVERVANEYCDRFVQLVSLPKLKTGCSRQLGDSTSSLR